MAQSSPLALISVTDKTGMVPFARSLEERGFRILSTGGSSKVLRDSGIEVVDVSDYTESPEIMNGRVKTLHPRVHGGILMDRADGEHLAAAEAHGIEAIDLVVVNLYDFEKNAAGEQLSLEKAIEYIDIGGPTMLRAAAKNFVHCCPIIDPDDYERVIADLDQNGSVSRELRVEFAAKTFAMISRYDRMIASYFDHDRPSQEDLNDKKLDLKLVQTLRYGENPHQNAGFYTSETSPSGLQHARVLQGKELSYNNLLDLDAATAIVRDFKKSVAVAIIKHTNPCGVCASSEKPLVEVFSRALKCDPKSAFGGIVATNASIDGTTAESMTELFLECVAAPHFTDEAREVFSRKKNLRLLEVPFLGEDSEDASELIRSIQGGFLVQSRDLKTPDADAWKVATKERPTSDMSKDLIFAQIVCKHVKSNAIVLAKGETTLAIGAGQMSRVDSALFAVEKASEMGHSLAGSVMASDAFFPFRDTVDLAAKHGVKGVIQPGGSIRDDDSIQAADENQLTMVLTGLRHFKH